MLRLMLFPRLFGLACIHTLGSHETASRGPMSANKCTLAGASVHHSSRGRARAALTDNKTSVPELGELQCRGGMTSIQWCSSPNDHAWQHSARHHASWSHGSNAGLRPCRIEKNHSYRRDITAIHRANLGSSFWGSRSHCHGPWRMN